MLNEPLVSILTTVYNREKYLADAIESVLALSYQNWELILVDDGSIDNSIEIARKYAAVNKKIRLIENEINLGDYPNRNKAAKEAKGKYLKYLDCDDLLYKHGISVMVEHMEMFDNVGLGLCKPDDKITPLPVLYNPKKTFEEHFLGRGLLTNSPLGTIILREAFEQVGGFSGKRYIGDMELWMKIALEYNVVKMVSGLAFYRSHDLQEKKLGIQENVYPQLEYDVMISILKSDKFPLKVRAKDIILNYKKRHIKRIISLLLKLKIKKAVSHYNATSKFIYK